jgi:hypothetical protein
MPTDDLKSRIVAFRHSYLDTPKGREHYQSEINEQQEVSQTYATLARKAGDGADVTDDVLMKLLPYVNTTGNRQRGTHISTWPCITKDIKAWFEGAGWKKNSEWPDVARWLLEIVGAGAQRDWTKWQSLSQLPIQRGFACGFISPIVHCVSPSLPVINSKVVKTYKSAQAALGDEAEISSALIDYPENQQRVLDLVAALSTYGIHNLNEWDVYCHWNVDKGLGGGPVAPPPPPPHIPVVHPPTVGRSLPFSSPFESICAELEEAQWDTINPKRFEESIARAFTAMGCDAEHIGGSGEADVVVSLALGDETAKFVLDAKTCQKGSVKMTYNYLPLEQHQAQNEADFAIVVAPGFAGGNTQQFAETHSIGLMSTKVLQSLVRQHASFGMRLDELKEIMSKPGLIDPPVSPTIEEHCDRLCVLKAVLKAFEIRQRRNESSAGLNNEAVYWILVGGDAKFSKEQIDEAIAFLSNPTVGILRKSAEGYVLTTHPSSLSLRLNYLLQGL